MASWAPPFAIGRVHRTVDSCGGAIVGHDRLCGGDGGLDLVVPSLVRRKVVPVGSPGVQEGSVELGVSRALSCCDSDAAKSVTQGDVNVTFTLDGAGRRLTQTTSEGSVVLGTQTSSSLVRHYTDDSDNPTWSVDTTGGVSTTSRYLGLTGDGLGLTVTTTGTDTKAGLDLAGPRGGHRGLHHPGRH